LLAARALVQAVLAAPGTGRRSVGPPGWTPGLEVLAAASCQRRGRRAADATDLVDTADDVMSELDARRPTPCRVWNDAVNKPPPSSNEGCSCSASPPSSSHGMLASIALSALALALRRRRR
jgi:MYXO-CTERM domain-containing protein